MDEEGSAGARREPRPKGWSAVREAHEARERAALAGGEGALPRPREEQPTPELEGAGAASMVRGGGPVGTPQGPKASTVRAGQVERPEGPRDAEGRGRVRRGDR